jgi:hypothetical protein
MGQKIIVKKPVKRNTVKKPKSNGPISQTQHMLLTSSIGM